MATFNLHLGNKVSGAGADGTGWRSDFGLGYNLNGSTRGDMYVMPLDSGSNDWTRVT